MAIKSLSRSAYNDFDYIGIDQQPEFIEEARTRYCDCERTPFYQSDFISTELPQVDYVFASGMLGYRCKTVNFYTDMIRKLYDCATIVFAFNMLDKKHFPLHDLLIGHDQNQMLEFCGTLYSHVKLVSGYLDDDFTIFIYR